MCRKVYYHLGEIKDSMTYAMGAGQHFDVSLHSEYVHTIIAMCIDTCVFLEPLDLRGSTALLTI